MRFGSFIHRLSRIAAPSERDAIAQNLEHLLNTRKGSGSMIAPLGLGDYEVAATTRDAVVLLRAELEQIVAQYEPRLQGARVQLWGRLGYRTIRFELEGLVGESHERWWIDIDTTTRQVQLREVRT